MLKFYYSLAPNPMKVALFLTSTSFVGPAMHSAGI